MRVYLPLGWDQLATLQAQGSITGPVRGCAVDPRWRADAPEVDEEEWEYEAAQQAAQALGEAGSDGGLIVAADLSEGVVAPVDGWVEVLGTVQRRQVGALLDSDLAWFGLQELEGLLADR